MKTEQARDLAQALAFAFPSPPVPQGTIALYRAELERLHDYDAARDTIHAAIRGSQHFPRIATLLQSYHELARRNREARAAARGLQEAPATSMSEEVRAEIARLIGSSNRDERTA